MQSFVITLLTCSVTMSALALFYMAITPLLAKRYSEKGRYYAWLIIVIGLIVPFRPQFNNAFVKVDVPSETIMPIIQIGNGIPVPVGNDTLSPALPNVLWWQIAAAVWLAGVIVFLAYHIIKHYCFVKMVKRWSENITNELPVTLLKNLKSEMGISKQINLYQCSSIGSPMMIGFVNPRILLPKSDFAHDELRFILKHELVHYERKDLYYKCLVLIATAIHWFNPVVHLMTKAIDTLCETSCDAEVVQSTDADTRQHYSETIIGVVKYQSKLKTALSTNFYGGKKGMKNRISSIMDTSKRKTGAAILCCALILTMGTGMAFAANASIPDKKEPIIPTNSGISMVLTDTDGTVKQTNDGGKTWQPYVEAPNYDTYSVAEYEKYIEDFKAARPSLIASGNTTQEEVDNAIAIMEEQLAKLRADNGKGDYVIYKPIDEKTWTDANGDMWGSSFSVVSEMVGNYENIENATSYSGTITLSNGDIFDTARYATREEMLSAVKSYCEAEVKAGRMSQAEADKSLADLD